MSTFLPGGGNGAKVFDNNYIDEVRMELLGEIMLTGKTLDWAYLIPNVKNRVSLNEITNVGDPKEASCGWNTDTTPTFQQRDLIVAPREIKDDICPKELEKTYMGMYMRTNKEVPFERVIANQYVQTAKKDVEKIIWNYSTGSQKGLYQIADTEAGVDASAAVAAAGTWIARINAMVAAAPAVLLEREDACIAISYSDFVAYQQELIAANLFHYDANVASGNELYVPGTNVKVRAIAGLNGILAPTTGKILIMTYDANIAVGTDMVDTDGMFDMWYSRDNDTVRVNVQYKVGGQFFFPDLVVKGYVI